ncbi:MAG TPA: enolase C-terminal domain-like protein, partial [Nitrolancea sp.]|nr:enolase C-terminal domain-like protein [Nitrolancea sp.]
ERLDVSVYRVPTDLPEADGTFSWDATTVVCIELFGGGMKGLGFTYADESTATLIRRMLSTVVIGLDAMSPAGAWDAMMHSIRNLGRPGVASMAIAAVDAAFWDLKARLLGLPLVTLLGAAQDGIPIYGSGGFTTYTNQQLQQQFSGWAESGISMVKMKIGTHPDQDLERVRAAREAIGPTTKLFVDANGAYSRKQALAQAELFTEFDVSWFEEPVSSDDLAGLHLIRDRGPAPIEIAAGEYGYDLGYFRRMLEAEAVDVLQADASRCAGISEFMRVAALCEARSMSLSAHCAPSLHVHPCCALTQVRHLEYFHDHVRCDHLLFDGVIEPRDGKLYPDRSRPGMGLEIKRPDAERYAL